MDAVGVLRILEAVRQLGMTDTHKQDMKLQSNLMESIDRLTNRLAELSEQNKVLEQEVNDLLSQISVGNR